MKLLIEYQQSYWRVELITSSSKEVFESTTPAEIPRLDTKAQSTSSVDLSSGTVVQRPRRSRRKVLRQRIDTFISYFACASRRSVREVEEQEASHIDSTWADQGIKYRGLSEMAESDVEIYEAAETGWSKDDFEFLYELDSTFAWRAAQPLAPQEPASAVSGEDYAQSPPDLFPHTASQKSSPVLPDTPTVAGSDLPPLQIGGLLVGNVSPYDVAMHSQHLHEFSPPVYELPESSMSFVADNSTTVQERHDPDLLNQDGEWPENMYQQSNGDHQASWPQMDFTTLHSDSQQATLVAPLTITPEDESAHHIEALLGTWELTGDSIWTRLDEDISGPDTGCKDASASHFNQVESPPTQEYTYALNRHTDEESNVSQSEASSTTQKEWPAVQCKHCNALYTGQYGAGNLTRHVNNTCTKALKLRKTHDCGICKNSYKRSDALRNHERRTHPNATITQPRKRSARTLGLVDVHQAFETC
ncbi:hypothetical protein N0V95_002504 [Ascochyta clinopodiicola]|nr:hypothetical protein N0V95_002504 [Ascochyta clinopodiicola]